MLSFRAPRSLAALAAFAALAIAPAAPAQQVEGVAAIVNDEVISTYDVRQRMRLILATTGVRPTEELLLRVQQQAINSLIDERLQLQEAAEFEIEVEQSEIDDAMADLARQNNVSANEIRASLQQAGVDARTLEQQMRAEIAWQIIVSGRFRPRVKVSNDQIDQVIERLAESASKPQYLISEILLEAPPGVDETQFNTAVASVMEQLEQGAPFPAVARQVSSASSAIDGGDVGWVRAGEINPDIEAAIANAEAGQLVGPIDTTDGIYIIALRDKRRATDPERVTLKQVLVPVAAGADAGVFTQAEERLTRAKRRVRGCNEMGEFSGAVDGALVADLGAVAPSDLAPSFRAAVAPLQPGDISAPIRTPAGVVMLGLCARDRTGGAELPSRDQVENRLLDQQLSQLSRRYLRDLRRDATIETRVGN